MVKISDALKEAMKRLDKSMTPQLDAEVLLAHVLSKSRLYVITNLSASLTEDEEIRYENVVARRENGEPVQYITGTQEFMGLDFHVESGVLIPRGDTEVLVENVMEWLKGRESAQNVIADVGCGSGAISVSLASYVKNLKVYALDIMDVPLKVTEMNAKSNGVEERVVVKRSDMLSALIEEGTLLDAVVSNPPYIKDSVIPTLMREVKDYEPETALSGGCDGLIFYREITKQSLKLLKQGGLLAYEIGYDQGEDVCEILRTNGFEDVKCIKDLAGLDRVVWGIKG